MSLYAQDKIGIFDRSIDIGNPKLEGKSTFDAQNQTYSMVGAGYNMWFGTDEFQYLWTTIQGDFILRAELEFIGEGVDLHRKAGWIIKEDLRPNTRHVNASVHGGDGLTSLQYRGEKNANTEQVILSDNMGADVIQLERKGDRYIMSAAKFGEPFTTVQIDSLDLSTEVYIGLYVCSHNPEVLEEVKFRNVRIIKPVDEGFQPYRDYIGSNLEIMDVESGLRKVIYQSAHSIQAPNWTPDNQRLIYNSKGLLYNYWLKTSKIEVLNTGFADQNNNDHVLSFDGKLLGISHHNEEEQRASTLYYLPVEGDSTPVRVTKKNVGHSYLHGWSADKSKLIFTGHRKNQYDIYSVDVKTGEETQLTNEQTLDDGAEYSPDGKFVFFNSVRTGKMKIWKMGPDGENPKQLTFDEYNDWFPHASPDKKWIVFLSFPVDIDPNDHPFYQHCLVRLMPYAGGEPKVIGYVYGGQGTINVPSWSPDSKKIAFVTNTKH